jgi:hypothetical protein
MILQIQRNLHITLLRKMCSYAADYRISWNKGLNQKAILRDFAAFVSLSFWTSPRGLSPTCQLALRAL